MHWPTVLKLVLVLGVEAGLFILKIPVPPEVTALAGTMIAGLFPSVVKGWAP